MTTMDDSLGEIVRPSWLAEEERLQKVDSMFDRESMSSIPIKIIYVNTHDYIDKITCATCPITPSDTGGIIKKETLIKFIQDHKIQTKDTKYKLLDVLLCNFVVSPSDMPLFSSTSDDDENATNYVRSISCVEDVFIAPSIFMFHDINSMYFIYQEHEVLKNHVPLKSILKSNIENNDREPNAKKRNTKKVRISMKHNTLHSSTSRKKTRRQRH